MKIGFIGLGLMGIPMAKNILRAGGDLSIWNRTRSKAEELEILGAKVCDSKRDLAKEVDILITMVTAGSDVDDILFGIDGCVDALRPGSIVIDMSTIGVEWAETLARKLSEKGIYFVDAPVTGSTPKAITGELTIFIGAERSIYERVEPVLAMMGTKLEYMGGNGKGQAMKLVNNTLVAYAMIGLAEVMKLGGALGIETSRLAEVIRILPVSSTYIGMKIDNYVRDDFPVMFSLENMTKDITLAHDEMEKHGLTLEMLSLAHSQLAHAIATGHGDLDVSAIGKAIQK